MGQIDTSCLPTGTCQADEFRLRKTCRRCRKPLYEDEQHEHFPIAGVGVMHLGCAQEYCQEQGITLEDAVPICKHWRLKGHCIYEVSLSDLVCRCLFKQPRSCLQASACRILAGLGRNLLLHACAGQMQEQAPTP